jgi:GNAT superfamily N-acetyltransferase
MQTELKIRPYKTGDENQIVRLLNCVFGQWPKFDLDCDCLDHWRWKTIEGPLNCNNIYVAECGSEIIGTETRILLRAKVGKDIELCEQRADLAVDKEFRGKGVFSRFTDKLCETSCDCGVKHSYAIEGSPVAAGKYRRRGGFTPSNSIVKLVSIKNVDNFIKARSLKRSLGYKVGVHFLKILNRIHPRRYFLRDKFEWKVTDSCNFDERFEKFWVKISEQYDYILVRDQSFLKWRYGDQRGGKYHVKIVENGPDLIGYVVLRVNRHRQNYPVGYIVDLLALSNRKGVVESLVSESMAFFTSHGVNEVQYWVPRRHPHAGRLKRFGFINILKDPFIHFFCYDQYQKMKDIFSKSNKIYLSFGDCDLI